MTTGQFVDSAPRLVLNQPGRGIRVSTRLQRELQSCLGFRFYVAFANQEGVATLLQTLKELEGRKVPGRVLVSQYLNFTDPVALRTLLKLRNLEVRIATEGAVHAKGYYFEREGSERYIIGSSNWTAAALATNTELNVQVDTAPGSPLAQEIAAEFDAQFARATPLTPKFIDAYEALYREVWETSPQNQQALPCAADEQATWTTGLRPNSMQIEALQALAELRRLGQRKALIISATGTGKTFLSAFDVHVSGARRMLFVVHRENIARAAMASFKRIFGNTKTYGLYSGNRRESEADFVFCTVQTLSRPENLDGFSSESFDYIIVDESHRAGAASYARFLNHFEPRFLLGMTATPERSDGADIFQYFDYNIGYEIRLQRALEEGMLCPFHYFGVTDLTIDGNPIEDHADFNRLTASERVDRILEKTEFYGCDDGVVRGLVFCSRVEEARALSEEFNLRGLRTLALDGASTEAEREDGIRRLEYPKGAANKLDYLFSVDIFNEGVDIPQCNQVVFLRPTQSAIIFVQQLGRGLRRVENKEKYLTVIDFIGNYTNNFLIPIALFGERSYDKDRIRRLVLSGSECLPGTSTVDFDEVARQRIFQSINSARVHLKRDLKADFDALRSRIGRLPMMQDFRDHDLRDPASYVDYMKSFYAASRAFAPDIVTPISPDAVRILEVHSSDGMNGKTLEEPLLLGALLKQGVVQESELESEYQRLTGRRTRRGRWQSAKRSVDLRFLREKVGGRLVTTGDRIGVSLVSSRGETYGRSPDLDVLLSESTFDEYLRDLVEYAKSKFFADFSEAQLVDGFVRYRKYRRSDVFRILGARENPVAQNVGGYMISPERSWCPVFVTYHKQEEIAATTQYKDKFLDRSTLEWFSKSKRTLASPDVDFFRTSTREQQIPLFVQKNNDEGIEFYYVADVKPDVRTFQQKTMPDGKGGEVPVVRMELVLDFPVEEPLYEYLTN